MFAQTINRANTHHPLCNRYYLFYFLCVVSLDYWFLICYMFMQSGLSVFTWMIDGESSQPPCSPGHLVHYRKDALTSQMSNHPSSILFLIENIQVKTPAFSSSWGFVFYLLMDITLLIIIYLNKVSRFLKLQ